MCEFILFADMQFYKNPRKSYLRPDGISSWTYEQMKILDQIVKYAHEHQVRDIFHNGDLFQEKNRIPQDLYNGIWSIFRDLNRQGFRITLNTGNHDMYLHTNDSSLKPFTDICKIITAPEDMVFGRTQIRIIPWSMTQENLQPLPKDEYKLDTHILLTHEEIAGLKVGPLDYELGSKLKSQIFGDWDIVFNGHVHKPQEYKNIINIGSPMVQDWGEAGEEKRFIHYKNGEVKSIPTDCPKFIYVDGLSERIMKKVRGDFRNYYKIDIDSEEIDVDIFKKFNVVPNITKSKKREVRMKPAISKIDELREYIRLAGTPAKLDRTKLLAIGKKLLEG